MPFTLRSDRLEIEFGESPLVVERITHAPSGRVVSAGAVQRFLLRIPKAPSDPVHLTEVGDVEQDDDALAFTVADTGGQYRVRVRIAPGGDGLRFDLRAEGPGPLWMVEWSLAGLDLDEVVVPALGGQALTRAMPEGTQVSYKYPFWWNAQFALGELGEGAGGVWLRTMDVAPRFKLLRVNKVEEAPARFALGLGFEADAPITEPTLEATFFFDGYAGDWREPTEKHRRWLEGAFGLVPYRAHPSFPAWADDVTFVLEVWGMRKDLGRPAHTFDETIERIEAFAEKHPPEQTLLYLPGYAEGGIDSRIPDYDPGELLGGDAGLRRLVDAAHRLGYRVMIHTNVLGMTYTHPRFPEFAEHQVADPFGQKLGWGNDMDGDWLPEPFFAYINPGAEAWGDLMEETLGRLIRDFDLDGVFLDQTLLAFNVSNGPNFLLGMREHVARLQRAFPGVLFAGEGLNEQVLPALPFVQIHGIDSIGEVHGMEGEKPWRRVHPVSVALFGPHTRFVAHLLTKHPSSPAFAAQEAAYAELGVVPALVLYRKSQGMDGPAVEAMLERARDLADKPAEAA
jgi:hypothetical protein